MTKSKVKQTASEVTVGLFVFAILGALVMFTIVLSYDNIFTRSYRMQVYFESVTGLIRGDKVYVQGVDIGRVNSLEITDDGVRVDITMKRDVKLREDYVIQVKSSSVLGGKYIDVIEGSKDKAIIDPSARITGKEPVDFIEEATEAIGEIRATLEEGGVLGNLEETMKNLKEVTGGLERGEGTIGKLLKDDAVYADLKQITTDLKDISGRLSRGEGTLGKLLSSDETVYNDLQTTLNSINDSVAKVGRGEGTLGKLVHDEALYDELMKTLAEIRAMFDDIRETSPVTSLSSIFFGAF